VVRGTACGFAVGRPNAARAERAKFIKEKINTFRIIWAASWLPVNFKGRILPELDLRFACDHVVAHAYFVLLLATTTPRQAKILYKTHSSLKHVRPERRNFPRDWLQRVAKPSIVSARVYRVSRNCWRHIGVYFATRSQKRLG
jgi:hypothetical protein